MAVPSVQPDAQGHAPAAEGPIVVDRFYKGQQSQASIERAAARRCVEVVAPFNCLSHPHYAHSVSVSVLLCLCQCRDCEPQQ